MEKMPIKRNENIVKLSRDHHASLLFCWKLRQGIKYHSSIERMVKYVQYFWNQHFTPHFKEEEEFLFAPVKDKTVNKAIEDHIHIKASVDEIINPGSENKQEKLSALADMVDEHVRYEERILFPHLEKKLTEEQLENIGNKIAGESLKDNYEDTFWIKPKSL
jgi:hemerythrin-like domain-containing protein